MFTNQLEWVQEAMRRADYHVSRLIKLPEFKEQERQDLNQDFLIKLFGTLAKNEPKTEPKTFMEMVYWNFSKTLRSRRDDLYIPESLETLIQDSDEERERPIDALCDEGTSARNLDLKIDIDKVRKKLPDRPKFLSYLIGDFKVHEIAKRSKLHRSWVTKDKKALRAGLIASGIRSRCRKAA